MVNEALGKMDDLFAGTYEADTYGRRKGMRKGGWSSIAPEKLLAVSRGRRCSNETHESRTDGDVRLYRKGKTATPGVKQPKA